ncbi:hypothetical protein EYR40_005849 [Pleurotus pulmonarius]|nr:hypothetical protein EYR36_005762 [Pleurotus pulmonarius]KAF4602634.1 hypothetical protein EYR40_005849 [Pleurotus pulmonarius]
MKLSTLIFFFTTALDMASDSSVTFQKWFCRDCGRQCVVELCASKANAGKYMVRCNMVNKDKPEGRCTYFRWVTPEGSRSPTPPPTTPSSPLRPSSTSQLPLVPRNALRSVKAQCQQAKCNSTRLSPYCSRKMCRKHCLQAGGCLTKNHDPQSAPLTQQSTQECQIPELEPLNDFNFLLDPVLRDPSPLPQRDPSPLRHELSPPAPRAVPLSQVPRYATQMPPLFTTEILRRQEQHEIARQSESERLDSLQRVKRDITVYAWNEDGNPPVIMSIQDGFSWPHFIVSQKLLEELDLKGRISLYSPTLLTWTQVKVGHVIVVHERSRVFLKSSKLRDLVDFEEHRNTAFDTQPLHFRLNLARERSSVRSQLRNHTSQSLSSLPAASSSTSVSTSSSISSDDDASTSSPPRKRSRYTKPEPKSPTRFPSVLSSSSDVPLKAWPTDFYVSDLVRGFKSLQDVKRHKGAAFVCIFGPNVRWVSSTYYSTLERWRTSGEESRRYALSAKETPDGLWSNFLKYRNLSEKDIMRWKGKGKATLSESDSESEDSSDNSSDA